MNSVNEHWKATSTGNMTLSVLSQDGEHILTVNMLSNNIMKAGTNGELLARALNNLTVVARFVSLANNMIDISDLLVNLPFPDAPIGELPWSYNLDLSRKTFTIKDAKNKNIGSRKFPAKTTLEHINEIMRIMDFGITHLNKLQ